MAGLDKHAHVEVIPDWVSFFGFLSPMITKLPRWVWAGAWALAFVAGIVNVVGLLGFEHQAVTHLTGTTSMLAAALASFDGAEALHFAAAARAGGRIPSPPAR